MIEIATLPTSDDDTARIECSSTGRHRASTCGGVKPNSQSVISGRSISRKSARNASVTTESSEPNAPAGDADHARWPRRAARPRARPSALRILSSAPALLDDVLEARLLRQLVPVAGQRAEELLHLLEHRARRPGSRCTTTADDHAGEHGERRAGPGSSRAGRAPRRSGRGRARGPPRSGSRAGCRSTARRGRPANPKARSWSSVLTLTTISTRPSGGRPAPMGSVGGPRRAA